MLLLRLLEALGGLGLFILGMKTLAEGLQRLASGGFRRFLEKVAGNRLSAALTGSCLASFLQSSGAASILIIGFVNAGLLTLYQALGMLLGTALGTVVAVQFIAFKISFLSLPAVFMGVALRFFSKQRRLVFLGDILIGLGLLFLGLEVMESRFSSLGEYQLLGWLRSSPMDWRVVSLLAGTVLTFLVQSGSAAIGIIIALAASGLIGLEQGVAMVLGEMPGTLILAAIGAIGGTLAARRTVMLYGIICIASVAVALFLFPQFLALVTAVSGSGWFHSNFTGSDSATQAALTLARPSSARILANGYTIFSILVAALFLPFIGFFARSAGKILTAGENGGDFEPRPRYLDFRVINTPYLALLQAGNEMKRMAHVAVSMLSDTVQQFYEFNAKRSSIIRQKENVLDVLQKDLSAFLVLLSSQCQSPEISSDIPLMLGRVNELEAMGDNCEIILDCLRRKKEGSVFFSETAMTEIKSIARQASYLAALAVDHVESRDIPGEAARQSLRSEMLATAEELKKNHLSRLSSGACSVIAGLLYMDIVDAFVKIGDCACAIMKQERGVP
jgi:phosphate:Na+ symporter